MSGKAELETELRHIIKVTINHGGRKITHEVRKDEENARDREAAKNKGD